MTSKRIVAVAGGVGGAKLVAGLQSALRVAGSAVTPAVTPAATLTAIVNTGDDFEHWGLTICPDLDTVLYNLAGVHNPEFGWGRQDESFNTLQSLSLLGGEDWFRIGDRDLALHLRRSEWLRQGATLTEVTDRLRRAFGVTTTILPMANEPVRTLVHTDEGDLPFQHYFVRRRCEPIVFDLTYVGASEARITPEVRQAISGADLIVFCPSNPYLSVDPILAIPGMRQLLLSSKALRIAVSPIVGGRAIKGPAAKMMREMGQMPSPLTVIDHFVDLLDGFVLDQEDDALADGAGVPVLVTDTLMPDDAQRARVARAVLDFGASLAAQIPHAPARVQPLAHPQSQPRSSSPA